MTNVRGAIETRRWLLSDLSHLRLLKQCCPSDTVSENFEARNKDFPYLYAFARPALEERPSWYFHDLTFTSCANDRGNEKKL